MKRVATNKSGYTTIDEQYLLRLPGLGGWHMHWLCSNEKKGYSGVATLCREAPLSVVEGMGRKEHDDEGRVLTVVSDKHCC